MRIEGVEPSGDVKGFDRDSVIPLMAEFNGERIVIGEATNFREWGTWAGCGIAADVEISNEKFDELFRCNYDHSIVPLVMNEDGQSASFKVHHLLQREIDRRNNEN